MLLYVLQTKGYLPETLRIFVFFLSVRKINVIIPLISSAYIQKECRSQTELRTKFSAKSNNAKVKKSAKNPLYSLLSTFLKEKNNSGFFHPLKRGRKIGVFKVQLT